MAKAAARHRTGLYGSSNSLKFQHSFLVAAQCHYCRGHVILRERGKMKSAPRKRSSAQAKSNADCSPVRPFSSTSLGWRESILWQKAIKRNPREAFSQLFAAHGELVHLYRGIKPLVLIHHPELVKEVLANQADNLSKTRKRRPVFGNGLVTSEGVEWVAQREMGRDFFASFEMSDDDFLKSFTQATKRLNEKAKRHEPFCLFSEIGAEVLAFTTQQLLGIALSDESSRIIRSSVDVLIKKRAPWYRLLLSPRSNQPFDSALRNYRNEVTKLIELSLQSPGENLTKFLRDRMRQSGLKVPLFDQVSTYLLASHDTTTSQLSSALCLIASHSCLQTELSSSLRQEKEQKKVRARIRNIIKEAMRLWPPVWLMSREVKNSFSLGDRRLRKGTEIAWVPFLLHRHPDYWKSPDTFIPDRFSNLEEQTTSYFPFGFGPRSCIGAHVSLSLGVNLLSAWLTQFEVHVARDSFQPEFHFVLRPRLPLLVSLSRREPSKS